jgi:hypothetical protein
MRAGQVARLDPETLAYCLMGIGDFLGMRWVLWEERDPPPHVIDTCDQKGTPCWPDFAGSGAATANPDYVRMLAGRDRSEAVLSPRQVMNSFYFRPPFRVTPDQEEVYLDAVLETVVADDNYPGDLATSANWPGVAPGTRGVNNALSPKYCDLSGFAAIDPKPPVLWIRGADDQSRTPRCSTSATSASSGRCRAGRARASTRRSR